MAAPFTGTVWTITDAAGTPVSGAKVYTYEAGTLTPKAVYTTASLATPTSNPVIADSSGRAQFFMGAGSYRFRVFDAADAEITALACDNVLDPNGVLDDLADDTDAANGAGLVAYSPTLEYAAGTVGRELKARVNLLNYIPTSLWDDIADGSSTTDVYSYLQAGVLANPGKELFVPAGLYRFTRGFYLTTGQTLIGEGGTVFKALAGSWVGTTGVTGTAPFVWNEHNNTTTLTDEDISVENIEFDYDTVTVVGGGAHAIRFRAVNRPRVVNCRFSGGENATAFLACKDSLVDECEAFNNINCFYDHWDGSIGGVVRNCIGRNASGTYIAQGIQFTGTGSAAENRDSYDFIATGNRLYGVRAVSEQASAIIFNSNDAGSSIARCLSRDNYVEDSDQGIVFQGGVGQHLSDSDTLRNVTKLPIFFNSDASGSPANCEVRNPHLIDCNHLSGNIALVSVTGTNNRVTGLRVTNTSSAPYVLLAWLTSGATNCVVTIEKAANGSGGARIQNDSSTALVVDRDDLDANLSTIPTIASATTIAPVTGTAFVSGTTSIATITVPPGCKNGGSITLIATGGWATTTAGNIATVMIATAQRAYVFTYVRATAKWYPTN